MANMQQGNVNIVLPLLPVPFSVPWGHDKIFKINRELDRIHAGSQRHRAQDDPEMTTKPGKEELFIGKEGTDHGWQL